LENDRRRILSESMEAVYTAVSRLIYQTERVVHISARPDQSFRWNPISDCGPK